MAGSSQRHAKLKPRYKFAYGIGHLQNDLTASLWFSFLLTYFVEVIGLSTAESGALMLLGQVVDALFTPVVGKLSDRTVSAWGKRRPWHLGGAIAVGISFPLMIAGCVPCELLKHFDVQLSSGAITAIKMAYYGVAVTVFQLGWASNQVAHLAMCPELTKNELERTQLNSLRYAVTVISMMAVYCATWVILGPSAGNRDGNKFDERDQRRFVQLSLAIVAVGAAATAFFHREMAAAAREEQQRAAARGTRRASGPLLGGGEGRVRISEARVTVIEGLPPPLASSPRGGGGPLGSPRSSTAGGPMGAYRTASGDVARLLAEAHAAQQQQQTTQLLSAASIAPAAPAAEAAYLIPCAAGGSTGGSDSGLGVTSPRLVSYGSGTIIGADGSEIVPAAPASDDAGSLISEPARAHGGLQRQQGGGLYRTATFMNDDIAALVSSKVMGIGYWFRQPEFYVVATVYMCTRLVVNTSQVYMPLFLLKSLRMPMDSIAQVPLLMCVASLAATVAVNRLTHVFGVTAVAVASVGISAVACFSWLHVAANPASSAYFTIVGIVLVLGWSSSIAMVSSLTMAASLTGRSNVCGALLYGIFSFTDKLSSGVVIMVVETLDPCSRGAGSRAGSGASAHAGRGAAGAAGALFFLEQQRGDDDPCDGEERALFFRHVISFVPGCAALAALVALLLHVVALGSGWAVREAAAAALRREDQQARERALREPLLLVHEEEEEHAQETAAAVAPGGEEEEEVEAACCAARSDSRHAAGATLDAL